MRLSIKCPPWTRLSMFSSKEYLEKKTGPWGVGRFKYLQRLVTEFQDTSKHENKLQVLANLANFAYDPINYEYFRQLNILDLFLDVLAEEKDEKMVEFAMGGVCNCCLDEQNKAYLLKNECVDFTVKCLSSSNEETVLSAITTLTYLTTPESKKAITEAHIVDLMKQFSESSNTRLSNLATIFLEDTCEVSTATGSNICQVSAATDITATGSNICEVSAATGITATGSNICEVSAATGITATGSEVSAATAAAPPKKKTKVAASDESEKGE